MKKFAKNNTQDVLKDILEYYYSKIENDYIPGILNEGNLYEQGNELYIKIIAKQKKVIINNTWIKENLEKDYSNGVFNIITSYLYKYNNIYGVNPFLLNDDVTFIEQEDIDVFNMEYVYNDKKVRRNQILYKKDDNIMVYFPLVKEYTNLSEYSSDYDLYAEIEYRVYIDGLKPDHIGTYKDDDGNFIDLIYKENSASFAAKRKEQFLYWIRATMKLDFSNKFKSDEKLNIKVVELGKNEIRDLNQNNYDDDIETGLIVFGSDAVHEIKKYYYFYDLKLIPKIEHVESSLVDYFDNIIVFWEGEFNSKLPLELKKSLQEYNLKDKKEKIISEGMFNWQLQGRWEVFNDLYPNQQLARIVSKDHLSVAIDHELDFYPPLSIKEYSDFIKKIFSVLNLNKDRLRLISTQEQMLDDIINERYEFNSNEEMTNNFYGFCYLVAKVIRYDEE